MVNNTVSPSFRRWWFLDPSWTPQKTLNSLRERPVHLSQQQQWHMAEGVSADLDWRRPSAPYWQEPPIPTCTLFSFSCSVFESHLLVLWCCSQGSWRKKWSPVYRACVLALWALFALLSPFFPTLLGPFGKLRLGSSWDGRKLSQIAPDFHLVSMIQWETVSDNIWFMHQELPDGISFLITGQAEIWVWNKTLCGGFCMFHLVHPGK